MEGQRKSFKDFGSELMKQKKFKKIVTISRFISLYTNSKVANLTLVSQLVTPKCC